MYTNYVNNHEHGIKLMKQLESSNEKFRAFLEQCMMNPKCKGLNLESYLIMPIQRIPRYKLLVTEIMRHTLDTHPDWPALVSADKVVNLVARHINEAVRSRENRERIYQIQEEFTGNVNFVAPHRYFVRRGPLVKKCRSADKEFEFFLFNDLLVYASSAGWKYKMNRELPINASFQVEDLPDLTTKFRFKVHHIDVNIS
eukprot:TRINITY_DN9948_c0_g1_i1.p1 TRINITY_DN9948_c0_g1~~TRINITY_DN9948_c0_g1_i1.p1  ORF type:complete len:233 (-),score=50.37 TRINITY_DN9948_c0_g1_i1:14-610(-)